ncbi:MAG: DUF4271 domain-containing protein [Tannerella sp.]|nr:DUF4271 domain-containing protein [Tannerella sp.]
MGTSYFDGYTGIRLGDGQFYYDILLLSVILLSALYSAVLRYFYPLLVKMSKDLMSLKERQSIFDTDVRKNVFFDGFMQFQAVFLVTVFCFLAYFQYAGRQNLDISPSFAGLCIFFGAVCLYTIFKRLMYYAYGRIFSEKDEHELWSTSYDTIYYLWESALYFPVLWLIFDGRHAVAAFVLFLFIYILFRIAVVYITIRIFYNKNTGILYLSLYLCAQEIIPLLFLYEGFKYLHNIIQTSTLWH